jgi:rhodanese-related sulfurtransferase
MNRNIIISLFALITILFSSCDNYYNPGLNIEIVKEDTVKGPEIDALLRYIKNSGDYINSKSTPNLVNAEDVYENLTNYFVVDIRSHEEYVDGHINGAVNVKIDKLIDYLEKNVAPSSYKKIIIACHSGQSSSYATSILRLLGYSNAFSIKYGMSAWNRALDKWSSNVSNKYANKLDITDNPKSKIISYPEINTGQHCGAEILEARAKTVLTTPFHNLKISADRAFTDTSFYIINYWPKEKYLKGHVPGAIQYTPKQDLADTSFLNTLPTDRKILVYAYTGQHSAFVVAYLRLLGYNAFSIGFGANSFMHDVLVSRENWNGFKATEKLNDFPMIKGENPTDKKFEEQIKNTGNAGGGAPKKAIKKHKKKEVEGGCG